METSRTIPITILDSDNRTVTSEIIPDSLTSTENFVKDIFPASTPEYFSRSQVLNVWGDAGIPKTTSLFYSAVHSCFQNHYPLSLRPEVLWNLILHEIGICVQKYPEMYRYLFTRDQDTSEVHIHADHLIRGSSDNNWGSVLDDLYTQLRERIPPEGTNLLDAKFSTTTSESQCTNIVGILAAASPFYDYFVWTKCGIPEIQLVGSVADYQQLASKATTLSSIFEEHLGNYFGSLVPILAKLAEQADPGNELDNEFWSSIYSFQNRSGSKTFNGWITTFINYIQTPKKILEPAKAFPRIRGLDFKKAPKNTANLVPKENYSWKHSKGLELGCIPAQLSKTPFTWIYLGTEYKMSFIGGALGLEKNGNFVTPRLGYAILNQA